MHRTELSASNPAVGEERAQAWRGEPRHGPGAQAAPARRLGQPWSAGTRLRTSTQPDASTRQHQAPPWGHRRHVATNGGCCYLSVEDPAGQHIPKNGNEFNSIPTPASPLSQTGPQQLLRLHSQHTASEHSHSPSRRFWGAGRAASLGTASPPSQQPILGLPVCWEPFPLVRYL